MKKFLLTSDKFEGSVTIGYDIDGDLVFYNNEIRDKGVIIYFKRALPVDISSLEAYKLKSNSTITEIPEDLSFNRFWTLYNKKINRKRTEPLFEKLSEAKKM